MEVLWDDGTWWTGEIAGLQMDDKPNVSYDTGEYENGVEWSRIRGYEGETAKEESNSKLYLLTSHTSPNCPYLIYLS